MQACLYERPLRHQVEMLSRKLNVHVVELR